MSSLPTYVSRPGENVHLQPYDCNAAKLYGFYLKADPATVQARLVDPILNAPTGGACAYQVVGDLVLISFADAAHCGSTLPPDSGIGFVRELSCTLWIPLLAPASATGPERLVFYPAYISVDNSWSFAAGREVYGFPKSYGPMEIPSGDPAAFMASALVMPTFGPNNQGVVAPLVTIKRTGPLSHDKTLWNDLLEAIGAVVDIWKEANGPALLPELIKDLIGLALHKEVPGVFLKQFRDATDGTRACYQAIIEAGSFVTAFRGGGVLDGDYAVTLPDYASHPIASDLGLAAGDYPLELGFHADFDFTIAAGREIWRATSDG